MIDVLTINEEGSNKEDLIEMIWKAFDYFPEGIWEGIKFRGNININHDLKVNSKDDVYGAFIFNNFIDKMKELKRILNVKDLLMALTLDPVVLVYHKFISNSFKRVVNLVHDYVSDDIGVISFFETDVEIGIKIAAHGLGHNQGLNHHNEPIDLMYVGLLETIEIKKNGFCDDCQKKLENN